jgi:DNA-binding response OmpR family regulator
MVRTAFSDEDNYTVIEANTAAQGLLDIIKYVPDVIILDVHLHDCITGIDILNAIEQNKTLNHIHIFTVTSSEYELVSKSITLGADDYFIKPFNIKDLVSAVKRKFNPKLLDRA